MRTGCWLGAVVAAISFLILGAGWGLGLEVLIRFRDEYVAMVPSTSISLGLLGIGLACQGSRRLARLVGLPVAAATGGVAGLHLLRILLGVPGLGGLGLFDMQREGDAMAFSTAAGALLGAYCLAALSHRRLMHRLSFAVCGTLGMLLAGVAIVGYAFDSSALYSAVFFSAMALQTAVLMLALFIGLLLVRPTCSWMRQLVGGGRGSKGARRLFPIVILGPLLFGLLALKLTEAGAFDEKFRLALLSIAMMALTGAAVLHNAALENKASRRRLEILRDLERSNADKELLLREVYHRVKNNLQQISAMLRIEARGHSDPELKASFQRMGNRIHALGLVHQLLIAAPTPSEVSVPEFLRRLVAHLSSADALEERGLSLTSRADEDTAHLEVAMTFGLLINELVSGAVSRIAEAGKFGWIGVAYMRRMDEIELKSRGRRP